MVACQRDAGSQSRINRKLYRRLQYKHKFLEMLQRNEEELFLKLILKIKKLAFGESGFK